MTKSRPKPQAFLFALLVVPLPLPGAPVRLEGTPPVLERVIDGDLVDVEGNFVGSAWGDYNNDGYLDVISSHLGGTNLFCLNNRDGTLTRIGVGSPVQDADNHIQVAWGDYDNDGNLDLLSTAGFLQPTRSHNRLFRNLGDGTFSPASDPFTREAGYFIGGPWVDYDNDGFLDVLIYNCPDIPRGGRCLLFHNNGDGGFSSVAASPLTTEATRASGLLWSDYDNDGLIDFFLADNSASGPNRLYRNSGSAGFTRNSTNILVTDRLPHGAVGGSWGDYDGNGFPDLFVTTGGGDKNRLYRNNGDGTFTRILSGPMLDRWKSDSYSTGCAWGDYDNDGRLDLFVTSELGYDQLFRQNADGGFTEIVSGDPVTRDRPESFHGGVNWVDYDNDGFLDLNVCGGTGQFLYHNRGNSNAWLEVKCVGTVSNRSGIGAKVRVQAVIGRTATWQTRELISGSGYSLAPLVAHFGLGDATIVDRLRIEWPSGIVQEFSQVATRQILSIEEPPRLLADPKPLPPSISLKGGRGFQYQIEASSDLSSWSPLATLTVTNLNGQASVSDGQPASLAHRFYRALAVGR
jgi:hypothetical protein